MHLHIQFCSGVQQCTGCKLVTVLLSKITLTYRELFGSKSGCTAKGSKCGTGGKYVRLIVAISYAKGVVA